MRHQLTVSRSLIKFPLLALVCFLSAEVALPARALAGRVPVVPPDSSNAVGDTFTPERPALTGDTLAAQISNGVANALRTIQVRQSVRSINGKYLFISPNKVAALTAALSQVQTGERLDIEALEQQISDEMGGLEVDLTVLGTSESDLESAIETTNSFIEGLTREQLALAVNAPTLLALLQLLRAANDAADREIVSIPGGGRVGIVSIGLR
ncbi:MAG: hypothetical protein WBB01_06340 [Phormidesmis sp.]